MAAHCEDIAADLWHHYSGLDLRDLWRPGGGRSGLTMRMVQSFVDRLPPEAATNTACRDALTPQQLADLVAKRGPAKGFGSWSVSDLRMVNVVDLLQWLIYATYRVAGADPKQPKPYPRPGIAPAADQSAISREQFDRLQKVRDEARAARVAAGVESPTGRRLMTAAQALALHNQIAAAKAPEQT